MPTVLGVVARADHLALEEIYMLAAKAMLW